MAWGAGVASARHDARSQLHARRNEFQRVTILALQDAINELVRSTLDDRARTTKSGPPDAVTAGFHRDVSTLASRILDDKLRLETRAVNRQATTVHLASEPAEITAAVADLIDKAEALMVDLGEHVRRLT